MTLVLSLCCAKQFWQKTKEAGFICLPDSPLKRWKTQTTFWHLNWIIHILSSTSHLPNNSQFGCRKRVSLELLEQTQEEIMKSVDACAVGIAHFIHIFQQNISTSRDSLFLLEDVAWCWLLPWARHALMMVGFQEISLHRSGTSCFGATCLSNVLR